MDSNPSSSRLRLATVVVAVVGLTACATTPTQPASAAATGDPLERRTATATADATRLQSDVLALVDTALQRTTAETAPGLLAKDPEVRQFSHITRLNLGTSLLAIGTGPDPVDALLDVLTNTTLVADAARSAARGKAADSVEAGVLKAAELNEADAWRLAERWLDPAARAALRERILSWPGQRRSPAEVAYVRLSDIPRTGSASTVPVEGMLDSLRAAVRQAEQARLLGERSVFLAQRMPFALRWQAEYFAHNMVTMDESRRLLEQIGALTAVADSAAREVAGLPAQLSREREAALHDLFTRIERERKATLEQLALIVQQERSATLSEAAALIAAQRKGVFDNLIDAVGDVERRGTQWARVGLVVVILLIVALLVAMLGMLLLYHRLVQRMDRRSRV